MDRFILNITTAIVNQLCLEYVLTDMVKQIVEKQINDDFNFSMPVGHSNVFELTVDFSDFINRCLRNVLSELQKLDKKA